MMFAALLITLPTRSYSTSRTGGTGGVKPEKTADEKAAEGIEEHDEKVILGDDDEAERERGRSRGMGQGEKGLGTQSSTPSDRTVVGKAEVLGGPDKE